MIEQTLLQRLKDPKSDQGIQLQGQTLVRDDGQKTFPIIGGIPSFLKGGDLTGNNAKYQKFYDKVGVFTGSVFWYLSRLLRWDMVGKRKELLADLEVLPGQTVLETSIGAGANIPALTKEASYVGVDISMGMLRACKKYFLIKPYRLQLLQANAEELPFKEGSFDVVFHVGGINFFNDIPKAIHEMIRVAKPGAMILICDETQEHVESWYARLPLIKRYFTNVENISPPTKAIPSTMEDLQLRYKWDHSMYVITFRKPKS
ncbi:MAG: class I SAM-dependent methyltransferase [Chlamydiota bacterium]